MNTAQLLRAVRRSSARAALTTSRTHFYRTMGSDSIHRPSPPPLPREQQRAFEELLRKAQTPLAPSSLPDPDIDLAVHPDARAPIKAEFDGDINPKTGEEGGPKREPIGRWGEDTGGDWSFKGRVSDF